jgi:hypothetical protein
MQLRDGEVDSSATLGILAFRGINCHAVSDLFLLSLRTALPHVPRSRRVSKYAGIAT